MYQNSSVFVLPSLEEGVPRTILEAMACGIPVVCSRLPQLVDIVDGCGLLVPLKDSQALADSVSKVLLDSSLAEKFRENGRRNVVENHSWKDTVKKTVQLYKELIWNNGRGNVVETHSWKDAVKKMVQHYKELMP